jgi:peptide/nickel transport system permease protein
LSNAGIQLTALFGTVILVEDVFAWPGIGLYLSEAIDIGDFGTIAGVTLAMGLAYIGINLCVDLLQAWADPRIRL